MIRCSGQVVSSSGSGLKEGGQVGSVKPGSGAGTTMEGEHFGSRMKNTEGIRIVTVSEERGEGRRDPASGKEPHRGIQGLLYAVEVSNQEGLDRTVEMGKKGSKSGLPVSVEIIRRSMNV